MSTRLQKQFKGALLGGLLASLFCAHGVVGAATEVEPNDTQAQAQALVISDTGEATVSAMMGTASNPTKDLDIFAFDAAAGDRPDIMVVSDGNWDPIVYLYDSTGALLDGNDDTMADAPNPGSVSWLDPRINWHTLGADGRYFIAVTASPRSLGDNFQQNFPEADGGSGTYTLVVQGVTPPPPAPEPEPGPPPSSDDPMGVTIKVMHWHGDAPGLGKFKGKDPIPVAILSAPEREFDAVTMVDQKSLTFGATGDENSLLRCKKKGKDVKVDKIKDGTKDLVCYFRPDLADFQVGDVQAVLKGKTVDGKALKGSAALRIMEMSNKKEESWRKRHNVSPRGKK